MYMTLLPGVSHMVQFEFFKEISRFWLLYSSEITVENVIYIILSTLNSNTPKDAALQCVSNATSFWSPRLQVDNVQSQL